MTLMSTVFNTLRSMARELPAYKCHKTVWALKIKSVRAADAPTIAELEAILTEEGKVDTHTGFSAGNADIVGAWLTPEDPDYAEFPVSRDYVLRHEPVAGGYWVQYDDGYQSFSPAKAFEAGYALIPIPPETK